jgi:hypothetical protein
LGLRRSGLFVECATVANERAGMEPGHPLQNRGRQMYFVAAVLVVLAGLFYAAGHHEIGALGVQMCRYGGTFCENPFYLLVAAALAAVWGTVVSVK